MSCHKDRFRRVLLCRRRGMGTIWGLAMMGVLLVVGALTVDGAMLYLSRGNLQAAADSAALAGASGLTHSPEDVRARAIEFAEKNLGDDQLAVLTEDIEIGDWDADTWTFTPLLPSEEHTGDSVRVTAKLLRDRGNPLAMAFAQVFGEGESELRASATAIYRPRDIVLVLDLSGSMSDDSEIRHMNRLGREAIEANLRLMWQELGEPNYGELVFDTVEINSGNDWWIEHVLGLDDVPYPHPRGSWDEYIDYVQGSNTLDHHGYEDHYGGLTLLNYWMEQRAGHDETPGLWMTSQQPLTAVKNAVDVFIDFLLEEATEDRVGLSVYTSASGDAQLEHGLTHDFEAIRQLSRQRQAGHYHRMTNIGAGIRVGVEELIANGRPGTLKTIVVLTDGRANRPGSNSQASAYALDQARYAEENGIPIAAISLGTAAQTDLMREIADITRGVHFNVPGGATVADYEEPLKDVFRHIAAERPLRLVD